jgi:hypothetical protein
MGLSGAERTSIADVQSVGGSGQSTRTPSTFEDEKKTTPNNASTSEEAGTATSHDDTTPIAEADVSKYPHGVTLFFIIFALLMSYFLVALDLVCLTTPLISSRSAGEII